ncbi:LOW QUALITY PROTEIN: berberine bridge enzyme-like 17 [Jatropha curcas]|uniref:LOW QUALITY PROTEIN: berberine bridge enzyme-like 17 n=1 Tax=Jatropha curcas TaxID=180498 RepID=UPI001895C131|nr:LOW QUALITY PROTEIN: berberine bridge enzyme-like 17 [Jatropha curcas]
MKVFISFLIVSFPLFSVLATVDNFLNCFPNHVENPNLIFEAIYTPRNSSFDNVLRAYIRNRRFLTSETPKPVAIVTAKHESHVQATVICAKSNDLQIRIRSGGHDYEGLSYISNVPFVILDMFNLRDIDIDIMTETAWVQTGATLGELYYNIANRSKVHAFPAGVCPTVGVGGHFTGGGYGNMMRKYGLTVFALQLALWRYSTGGRDLFWAIRGGRKQVFGVILSWKIQIVQVPNIVTVFLGLERKNIRRGATDIVYRLSRKSASKLR